MSFADGSFRHPALILACALPIFGAFLASSGLFTIDELIYLISVEAMANHRSFIFDNGFAQFASNDLKLLFLVEGPNGLAPQYPPGVALLGTPFYLLMGARGLVLMNAIAASGVVILTWLLAKRLYNSTTVAAVSVLVLTFGTFHLEYAWGIWPHMTSAFCVLLAFLLALSASDSERTAAVLARAFGSGLAVGAGLLFRTDTVLILPIIAICIVLFARRPVFAIVGGLLGMLPAVVIGGMINMHKFGSPNILSYGQTGAGGGTDITTHLGVILCLGLGLVALFALRSVPVTRKTTGVGVAALVIGALVLVALPQTREVLGTFWRGFMALFVDSRTILDPRLDVVLHEDGSLIFWGIAKKALFQSLPWLSILVLLAVLPWRKDHVRPNAILLMFAVVWSLPFVALSWHGGLGSNMRYFIPMIPGLVILSSALLVNLAKRAEKPLLPVVAGILGGLALGFLLFDTGDLQTDGFTQQSMTLYIFFAAVVVVGTAAALMRRSGVFATPALLAVGVSFGTALFASVLVDVSYAQSLRSHTAATSQLTQGVDGPVLIYGAPKHFAFGALREDVLLATGGIVHGEIDTDLFVDALSSGYRAFASMETAEQVRDATDLSYVSLEFSPSGEWVEIVAGPSTAN